MAEFERIEKVSHLRIFTHNIKIRKFMISRCVKDISWDILHNNIPQHQTRKIIEALEIRKKNTETIMNGCIGRVLTIQ